MRLGIFIILMVLLIGTTPALADRPLVRVVAIQDAITPVTARFLQRNLDEAGRRKERLVLVELDTPGGLDASMRGMVRDILASPVPVAVYVAPSGARAASAGAIIAMAADVCAMAPGTAIGAAHPVAVGQKPDQTMETKVVNDAVAYVEGIARSRGRNEDLARRMVRESLSLSADNALAGGAIDLVARDRSELLQRLEGRRLQRGGGELTLQLAGAGQVAARMGRVEQFLGVISNPNIAYVLMMLGMMGLFFELSNPGAILPGVIGGICLILAFFAFQALPVNYAGMLLILLAVVLFLAEIKIVSHGMLAVGGTVALLLGSLLLFESSAPFGGLSWSVILVTVLATAGFFSIVVAKALAVHRLRPVTGQEGLVGQAGTAESGIGQSGGTVFVNGEYWTAWSDEPISAGSPIMVELVQGMRLKVRAVESGVS